MANVLHKIRKAATAMQRENPRMSYQQALKKAGKEYREGRIGAVKKKSKKQKSRYVPVKAEHCRKVGGVADQTLKQSMAVVKKRLVEQLGWAMVNRDRATTAKAHNRYVDQINTLKKKIAALS